MSFWTKFFGKRQPDQNAQQSPPLQVEKLPELSPAERRAQVERDKAYFCQVCGRKPAQSPGTRAYTVCSDVCAQEFEQMHMAVAFQGKLVIGAPADLSERMRSPRNWKHCKWCGTKMEMLDKTCGACGGTHPM